MQIGGVDFLSVLPVPTGINRIFNMIQFLLDGAPRTHGDKPHRHFNWDLVFTCSPYPRG